MRQVVHVKEVRCWHVPVIRENESCHSPRSTRCTFGSGSGGRGSGRDMRPGRTRQGYPQTRGTIRSRAWTTCCRCTPTAPPKGATRDDAREEIQITPVAFALVCRLFASVYLDARGRLACERSVDVRGIRNTLCSYGGSTEASRSLESLGQVVVGAYTRTSSGHG